MFRLLCCLLLTSLAQGATPVFQDSFERSTPAHQDWTVVRGSAALDSAVLHEGRKSLRLERDT
ncbi:MAG TPA: hypothetical protein VJV74_02755 [Terriglobia bacterium]|nr:hypothetical protein [Terriglobia bacterium]